MEAIVRTPALLRQRMFLAPTMEDMLSVERRSNRVALKKNLTSLDALFFGIGGVIGAGVFVVTGVAARNYAGPSVAISYLIAALSALLAATCYTEFAVQMPVAGGAFAFLMVTFGEFPAFITVSNLLLEYLLSCAAVARGFTSYFSTLIGLSSNALTIKVGTWHLDFVAVLITAILVGILCLSTKDSLSFNSFVTSLNIAVIAFVIIAGFANGSSSNITDNFVPYGVHGIFTAASLVFFSFVGFDSVATLAEELQNPSRDLPIGMLGSVAIVTILYVFMCLAICALVPFDSIDINAPFSVAFDTAAGWKWARYVVSLGAVCGIVTTLLVALLGQARIALVVGRAHLIPEYFSTVNERTGTPVVATIILGCISAALAFVSSLETLTSMVSIGTLTIFTMVSAALLFKRYHKPGSTSPTPILLHLAAIVASSIGLSLCYQLSDSPIGPVVFLCLWAASTLSLQIFVPEAQSPPEFRAPWAPWLPSASMALDVFLMATLSWSSWYRFFIWSAIAVLLYVFYGVHASHLGEEKMKAKMALEMQPPSQPREDPTVGPYTEVSLDDVTKEGTGELPTESDKEELWKFPSSSHHRS